MSKQYLTRECPDCHNTQFKILETVKKATMSTAGHYRVECTVCGFQELAISKQAYGIQITEHKRGKVPRQNGQE